MFKNKKIKKLFSVVCTVLTLNSTSSIFQHNPSAIKFNDNDQVDLERPLYCVIVHDDKSPNNIWDQIAKDYNTNSACNHKIQAYFDACLSKESADMIRVRSVHIAKYNNAMEALHKEIEGEECNILFILGITKETNLTQFPSLPTKTLISTVSDPTQLGEKIKAANLIPTNGTLKVTMQLIKPNGDALRFSSVEVQSDGKTSTLEVYKTDNPFTVADIKQFAENNITNPEKLTDILRTSQITTNPAQPSMIPEPSYQNNALRNTEYSDFTPATRPELQLGNFDIPQFQNFVNGPGYIDHNIPNDPKTYYPDTGWNNPNPNIMNIDPRGNETNPPLTNMSNSTSEDSSYAKKSEANFELDDPEITLITGLMNDADYPEQIIPNAPNPPAEDNGDPNMTTCVETQKTTIFSKTKELIQKHPITSVGLGAAILTMGGTTIYNLKKLFTRESKKSQAKNQINQKHNQHVKNKI